MAVSAVKKVVVLKSKEDKSVNFVFTGDFPYSFEARYVRRDPRKMAIYLSSQSGCAQGCWFCHLTITNQQKHENATPEIYLLQAKTVFDYYDRHCPDKATMVHFNFMARGEALANPLFLRHGQELFMRLGEEAVKRNLQARFLVSTIMPKVFKGKSLGKFFPFCGPEIYYSIYSVKDEFRLPMMPAALPVNEALSMLKQYHDETKKVVRLHWCFIEGKNDDEDDVVLLCHRIKKSGLPAEIRLVHYNPYSEIYGKESSEEVIKRNLDIIGSFFSNVKEISRVGKDVKASCGMFVEPGV